MERLDYCDLGVDIVLPQHVCGSVFILKLISFDIFIRIKCTLGQGFIAIECCCLLNRNEMIGYSSSKLWLWEFAITLCVLAESNLWILVCFTSFFGPLVVWFVAFGISSML